MSFFDRLFNQYKFVRRLLILWAVLLITYVVVRVFDDIILISAATVSALGIVVGILATVISFYIWSRGAEK